jgi:hypothetical protein
MLYGPHGPGAVPGGPESNRAVSGSPNGLPARPKHDSWFRPARARFLPCRAMLVPAHLTRTKIFRYTSITAIMTHGEVYANVHSCSNVEIRPSVATRRIIFQIKLHEDTTAQYPLLNRSQQGACARVHVLSWRST